jgi:hypothetical protein
MATATATDGPALLHLHCDPELVCCVDWAGDRIGGGRGHPIDAGHRAAVALLQATSLPFLLTISQIGIEMGSLERATAAALVAAGVISVLLFPPLALRLLASAPAPAIDAGPLRTTPTID